RNLKPKDEAGISSLSDAELFENLTLMGYNILPNQKGSIFPLVKVSNPYHYAMFKSKEYRQYTRIARIAQSLALFTVADELASPFGDGSHGEAFPTVSGLDAEHDRANIVKTSTLPHDSPPRVTSLATDEGNATIKGKSLKTGEEAAVEKSTVRGSNDTEELVNVLTSLDVASILTSGVQMVSVPLAAEVATVSVPTGSGLVSTASPRFTTASVVTPYSRRKGKERMVESDTPNKKKLQEQIDVQPNSSQLAREDLKQIDPDNLEEMDLQWEMAMLTIRASRFIKRTGRSLDINGQKICFDRSKVECFNCHKNGHLAIECRALKNQENKSREYGRKIMLVENPTKNALIAQDGIRGYD
nr:ribonuclease H-like domain-containing protein [Tanacetum cinerariifolium]